MRRPPCLSSVTAARVLLAALVCVGCGSVSWSARAAEPEKARAVMKQQEINFYYQAFTTFYSCDGIRDKVKRLLLALGAAKDIDVQVRGGGGCDSSNVVQRSPLVVIQLTSPVEATPEVLAELEKTRTQRELVAKVRGDRGTGLDAGAQFDATWTAVSLSRGKLGLDPGDCELVDELRKKVLPKLGVRIVKNSVSCSPKQINRGQPRLEVEALMPPPPPDASNAPAEPATAEPATPPAPASDSAAAQEKPQP